MPEQTCGQQLLDYDAKVKSALCCVDVVALHSRGRHDLTRLPASRLHFSLLATSDPPSHAVATPLSILPLLTSQHRPLSFPSSTHSTERRRLYILPPSNHPPCLPTSASVLHHPTTLSQPPQVSHELTAEEVCTLVRRSSRRERVCGPQRMFDIISTMLPCQNKVSLTCDHAG